MKLNNKQIAFCRLIVEKDYPAATAYREIYGTNLSNQVCASSSYKLLQKEEVKNFISHLRSIVSTKYNINKDKVFKKLEDLYETGQTLKGLILKDEKTDDDREKIQFLNNFLKGNDMVRINQEYNKMIGAYEPEQHEVKQTWNFTFTSNEDDNDDSE